MDMFDQKTSMESNLDYQINQHKDSFLIEGSQKFCNDENIDSCLSYLNQELVSHGMNQMFSDPNDFHISSLINGMFELLQRIHQSVVNKDILEEGRHKAIREVEQLLTEKKRLKLKLDASEREAVTYKNKVDCLYKELAEKEIKIKMEKEEVRSLQSLLRSTELQHNNAMKKEEREMNRLKDKLGSLLSDKNDRRPGSKISDSFLKEMRKRNNSNSASVNMETQECQNFQDDLKLLHESLCTFYNKCFEDDEMANNTSVSNFKSDRFGSQDTFGEASLQNSEGLLKSIKEQISRLNQKFEKRFTTTGLRHALKDKNSSAPLNFSYQQPSRTLCINRGGGDSTLRPKSAIQLNRKNIESKECVSRNKSMIVANAHKNNKSQQPTYGKKFDRIKHDSVLSEDKSCTKKPRRLIRSGSYTILKDQVSENGCDVIVEDVTFGEEQFEVRNDHNRTFACLQKDLELNSNDCYI